MASLSVKEVSVGDTVAARVDQVLLLILPCIDNLQEMQPIPLLPTMGCCLPAIYPYMTNSS